MVEGRDAAGAQFGERRLREVLDETREAPLHEVKRTLVESLLAHTGGSLAHDDVTFVAVEVR